MPPVGLTEAQFVILYFLRIAIVSSNKVMSKILVQIGVNLEVNTSSEKT